MKEKQLTIDLNHLKNQIKAMIFVIIRNQFPKPNEPFEISFSEKDLLAIILFACPWLKVEIDECVDEVTFAISSQLKDIEQQLTGKKEDA